MKPKEAFRKLSHVFHGKGRQACSMTRSLKRSLIAGHGVSVFCDFLCCTCYLFYPSWSAAPGPVKMEKKLKQFRDEQRRGRILFGSRESALDKLVKKQVLFALY